MLRKIFAREKLFIPDLCNLRRQKCWITAISTPSQPQTRGLWLSVGMENRHSLRLFWDVFNTKSPITHNLKRACFYYNGTFTSNTYIACSKLENISAQQGVTIKFATWPLWFPTHQKLTNRSLFDLLSIDIDIVQSFLKPISKIERYQPGNM